MFWTSPAKKIWNKKYLKNVQANISIHIHIGMEAAGFKLDLRGLKWVVIRKWKRHLVFCSFKHSIFASSNCPFPAEYIVFLREGRYPRFSTHLKFRFETRKLIQTLDHQKNSLFGYLEDKKIKRSKFLKNFMLFPNNKRKNPSQL